MFLLRSLKLQLLVWYVYKHYLIPAESLQITCKNWRKFFVVCTFHFIFVTTRRGTNKQVF